MTGVRLAHPHPFSLPRTRCQMARLPRRRPTPPPRARLEWGVASFAAWCTIRPNEIPSGERGIRFASTLGITLGGRCNTPTNNLPVRLRQKGCYIFQGVQLRSTGIRLQDYQLIDIKSHLNRSLATKITWRSAINKHTFGKKIISKQSSSWACQSTSRSLSVIINITRYSIFLSIVTQYFEKRKTGETLGLLISRQLN